MTISKLVQFFLASLHACVITKEDGITVQSRDIQPRYTRSPGKEIEKKKLKIQKMRGNTENEQEEI